MGRHGKGTLVSMPSLYRYAALKCVVVGDGYVGKTCMLMSFANNKFPMDHTPTVFENLIATVHVDKRSLQMGLFDTAGQEGYDRLRVMAYSGADICVVCFSVIAPESLKNACETWIPEIRHTMGDDAKILLVGTKTDLRDCPETLEDLRKQHINPVKTEEGCKLAKELNVLGYMECSAFTRKGLKDIFDSAAEYILRPPPKKVTGFRRLVCWGGSP